MGEKINEMVEKEIDELVINESTIKNLILLKTFSFRNPLQLSPCTYTNHSSSIFFLFINSSYRYLLNLIFQIGISS